MRRVVVTGMGGLTSLGADWKTIKANLRAKKTGIRYMPEWERYGGMHTRLGAPVQGFDASSIYSRKQLRSTGRVSQLSIYATEMALKDAGLLDDPQLKDGTTGVAYGSSFGSTEPVMGFAHMLENGETSGLTATSYIKMMSHTTPVNIGVFFSLKGRVITTSSACTSGSQGIGYAYEAIKYGKQDIMVAGGAEEQCPSMSIVFDTLYATSTRNDQPEATPRPYDKDRDGLVIGEGATTLILEELEHAKARGASIYGEVVGYGTNSDGAHITQPASERMAVAMKWALEDADLSPDAIGFVNGHGTATDRGDIAETQATRSVFQRALPIHSLKSYFGHTLGACGALEAWLGLEMMRDRWFAPTVNLENIDPECGDLDYVVGDGLNVDIEYLMSNNFAFGGINTSLIFKKYSA